MRRKQLYLTEALDEALRARAHASGRAEAELVREALAQFLEPAATTAGDPILALAGIGRRLPPEGQE